jgi:hypothetical protein
MRLGEILDHRQANPRIPTAQENRQKGIYLAKG